MKTFVTDISASTGRNDFIFDIWLWHGDLYRVSPFQVYCTSTSCLQCDLEFFMFAVMKTFVTVISASTGRNDFRFDIWLWHGDLYRVSPFQVYCTSTSCLPCNLQMTEWATSCYIWYMAFAWWIFRLVCDPFSGNECWDIYKFDTNERVGVFLARRSVQHLVLIYCHPYLSSIPIAWSVYQTGDQVGTFIQWSIQFSICSAYLKNLKSYQDIKL